MMTSRRLLSSAAALLLASNLATGVGFGAVRASLPASSAPPGTATAQRFAGTPTVGPLFTSPTSNNHFCTASVVSSPAGDLLLTAAHCITGTGVGDYFAPDFYDGTDPAYGRWAVTGVYENPGWVTGGDTQEDYAFLTVAPRTIGGRTRSLQSVTGAYAVDPSISAGEQVTVDAYNGNANKPITCTVPVYFDGAFPAYNCTPYRDGSSGSAWLAQTTQGWAVVGDIGGLHQGGCHPYTSYSPVFGSAFSALYARAEAGGPADVSPPTPPDGCANGN